MQRIDPTEIIERYRKMGFDAAMRHATVQKKSAMISDKEMFAVIDIMPFLYIVIRRQGPVGAQIVIEPWLRATAEYDVSHLALNPRGAIDEIFGRVSDARLTRAALHRLAQAILREK